MDKALRQRLAYEVQRRQQRGDSERAISRALAIHRNTVRRLLDELAARREAGESALEREVRPPTPRGSKLDRYQAQIEAWLQEYEDLTAVRLHEKLTAQGFDGGYTIVREHLKQLRGRCTPKQAFVLVETPVGCQAQFDWSPYTLPGCAQKIQLWGCTLSWSRARAFEVFDNTRQTTILICIKRSFERFGGVPQTSKAFDVCGNQKDPVMRRKRPVHRFSQGERAAELLIICARSSQRVEPREQCGLALPTRWLAWPC
jgi:transposase